MQRFSISPHRNENGVLLFTDEFNNTKLRTNIDSVELTDEEYAGLKSEINSNYSKHKGSKISMEHFSPNGENSIFAVFENYGFNKYRFILAGEYSYEDVDAYEEFAKRFNRRLANGQKNISEMYSTMYLIQRGLNQDLAIFLVWDMWKTNQMMFYETMKMISSNKKLTDCQIVELIIREIKKAKAMN